MDDPSCIIYSIVEIRKALYLTYSLFKNIFDVINNNNGVAVV